MMATPFSCTQEGIQVALNPANLYTMNLVTGVETLVGQIQSPGQYNAIGYNILDNYVYGYNITTRKIVIISPNATTTVLPAVPNLPLLGYIIGDVNLNGYYYLYDGSNRFYVVDVNPARSTYLQLVDPANNYQLQTSNFGVAIAATSISDWAFNPVDGQLYAVINGAVQVIRINPITGVVTPLTTSGALIAGPYGAAFFDSQGHLYSLNNSTGSVYKSVLTPTTATTSLFSVATVASNNDGTRCPLAQLDLMSVVKSVIPTTAVLGDRLTYTIVITNNSKTLSTTSVMFTDPYPNGTTYVGGSATVNGNPAVGTPGTGITIGTLAPGASVTVKYQVDISSTTLPYPNPIPNKGTVTYAEGLPIESNTVYTKVTFAERGIKFI